jgi:hypothetical protein
MAGVKARHAAVLTSALFLQSCTHPELVEAPALTVNQWQGWQDCLKQKHEKFHIANSPLAVSSIGRRSETTKIASRRRAPCSPEAMGMEMRLVHILKKFPEARDPTRASRFLDVHAARLVAG